MHEVVHALRHTRAPDEAAVYGADCPVWCAAGPARLMRPEDPGREAVQNTLTLIQ